jgi:membrane protease YdiL (CAAX protease family)
LGIGSNGSGIGSLLGEAGLVASVVAFHVADHRLVDERLHLLTHLGAGLAATAGAFALGADRAALGLDPDRLAGGVRVGLLAAAVPVGVIAGASLISTLEPVLADPRADHGSRAKLGYRLALDIPIGTSVYEELVFRSALLGLALRRFSPPVAVAVSSALFGLWHVLPALEDRQHNEAAQRYPLLATVGPTVVSTAVAGVGFAGLRLRAGHVVAPMIVHAVTNAAALVAATVVHRRRRRRPGPDATTSTVPRPVPA